MPALAALLWTGEALWPALGVLTVLGALLSLDETAAAQTWMSQPLPAALLAGWALGDPAAGLALGLPLQIVMVINLPVGQTFTGDAVSATVATTGAAILSGRAPRPGLAAGAADLPLVGWLLLGAALLSVAGHFAIAAERRGNTAWMLEGHRTLRDGDLDRLGRLHRRCLSVTALRGAVATAAATLLVLWVWLPVFGRLPDRAATACGLLAVLLPGLGLGALLERYGFVRSLPWFAAGVALVVAWRLAPW